MNSVGLVPRRYTGSGSLSSAVGNLRDFRPSLCTKKTTPLVLDVTSYHPGGRVRGLLSCKEGGRAAELAVRDRDRNGFSMTASALPLSSAGEPVSTTPGTLRFGGALADETLERRDVALPLREARGVLDPTLWVPPPSPSLVLADSARASAREARSGLSTRRSASSERPVPSAEPREVTDEERDARGAASRALAAAAGAEGVDCALRLAGCTARVAAPSRLGLADLERCCCAGFPRRRLPGGSAGALR